MQTEANEIPTQRNACRAFVDRQPGWRIVIEYYEHGVSGYHKASCERNALLVMKRDAESGLFDVLLVYMFDRLGRREDETPFIVEWLSTHGVTAWSVAEGPQRFEGQADRLVNYLRYWQSGSESVNTSLRVAEKHRQMVVEGRYRGGTPPFGYKLIPTGAYGKRGQARFMPVIDENEASVVRLMYEYTLEHNVGSYSLAGYLTERNIFTRYGHRWTGPAVIRTLKNPLYKGVYVCGRVKRERGAKIRTLADEWTYARHSLTALAIVTADEWETANAMIDRRAVARRLENATVRTNTRDMPLMGLAYCGYCGAQLSVGAKGTRYDCPRRMRQDTCDGAFGYGAQKLERIVLLELNRMLAVFLHKKVSNGYFQKIITKKCIHESENIGSMIRTLTRERDAGNDALIDCLRKTQGTHDAQDLSNRLTKIETALTEAHKKKTFIENALHRINNGYNRDASSSENISNEIPQLLMRATLKSVTVFKGRFTIKIRFAVNTI